MGAIENKNIIMAVFDQLSTGNGQPFIELLSDEVEWTVTGSTKFSRKYSGKAAVLGELLMPLAAQFSTPYKNTADRIIAEDDMVVIECRGEAMTRGGKAYNNRYCFVCRMANGKIVELTEFSDTALAAAVLT
jgi:uncharacterized protein